MSNDTQALHGITRSLQELHSKVDILMSGEDDLKAALAANAAAIQTSLAAITTKVAALVAAATGDSDADVETLANELTAETAQLSLGVSNALAPPQPAPAPNQGGAAVPISTANAPAPAPNQGGNPNAPATS